MIPNKAPKIERRFISSRWLRVLALIALQLMLAANRPERAIAQSDQADDSFNDLAASKLLGQLTEGLQGHLSRKMLDAFDLARMTRGATFKQQVTAFFNQYDSIRVHFKLVEVKDNSVIVNAQMDESTSGGFTTPQRKSAQLRFTAEKTPAGWKFVDVQPRSFFS